MTAQTVPDSLLELSNAFVASRALHVVAELAIADALDDEPCAAEELAAAAGVDADALGRLLRLLEAEGVFARDEAGRWGHSEASRWLRSDHPASVRAFARMSGTPFLWAPFTELHQAVRTGEPSIGVLAPEGPWAYLEAHPSEQAIFQEAMTAKAHGDVAAAMAVHDFSPYRRIADVGGGSGHLLRAVLDAYPDATGVLFDLPHVAVEVPPGPRLEVVAGDFFSDPLPACDAYLLMNVIHDWDDPEAERILSATAAAGGPGATVLLLETVLPDGPRPHRAKTLDVLMLAVTGGRERSLTEYDALLKRSGLDLVRVTPTATAFSIVEARAR